MIPCLEGDMKNKEFTVEYCENGYVLRLDTFSYVYTDEVQLLEGIKEFLDIEHGCEIEVKRKE